jgi:hypothetical protein
MLRFSAQWNAVLSLSFTLNLIPGVFMLIRYFKIGYTTKDTKKSVKDKILRQVSGWPLMLLNPGIIFLMGKNQVSLWAGTHPLLMSVLLLAVTLHVLAFVKLCHQDFKAYQLS